MLSEAETSPTKREVDEFIETNRIDDRAAADLRECDPKMQRAVLDRGDLSTARNSSAALLVRIRDARASVSGGTGLRRGPGLGLPTSADIDAFLSHNGVTDRKAAHVLRDASPTIKRLVISSGDLYGYGDPSNLLVARVRDAKAGILNSTGGCPTGGMCPGGSPSPSEIESFLKVNEVDEISSSQLRGSPPHVQRMVLSRGDLRTARNPSSALLARIRDARSMYVDGMPPLLHTHFPMFAGSFPHSAVPPGFGGVPGGCPGPGYPPGYYNGFTPAPCFGSHGYSSHGRHSGSYSYSETYSSYSSSRSRSRSQRRMRKEKTKKAKRAKRARSRRRSARRR